MNKTPPERVLGKIDFAGKDIPTQSVRYDRIALDRKNKILLVSLVAESQVVKGIRAILNGNVKCQISAAGGRVVRPDEQWGYPSNPGNCHPTEESYECHTQKLDFGLVHALFVTRMPGFMPVCSPESLWRELQDTRFTTPMLREWLPYIERRLKEQDFLTLAQSFNFPYPIGDTEETEVMRCGVLECTTQQLDLIVTEGIQGEHISIPGGRSSLDRIESVPVVATIEEVKAEPIPVGSRSFRYGVKTAGDGDHLSYNGCRYKTREEAKVAAEDLYSRWMLMRGYEIEESDDEPNY